MSKKEMFLELIQKLVYLVYSLNIKLSKIFSINQDII